MKTVRKMTKDGKNNKGWREWGGGGAWGISEGSKQEKKW
jgi:hypothetical protein